MNSNTNLLKQFVKIERLLRRHHQQKHSQDGLMRNDDFGQGRILSLLKLKPEMTQRELSSILEIRSQSLGELLRKLEKKGYITRTQSESDRRVMNIRLTESGKKISTNSNEKQHDDEMLFECFNEEEKANLSEYLNRITLELEKRMLNIEPDLKSRYYK